MHPKMPVNAENATNASQSYDAEEINADNDQISTELIEERIRAHLETLNEQIMTLTQLLNQLIHVNYLKEKTTPTASSHTHRPPAALSLDSETGVSRTSPDTIAMEILYGRRSSQ